MNTMIIRHIVLVFHFIDVFFTYLCIHTLIKIKAKNPTEFELNLMHRFFMHKFGLGKGIVMSSCISFTIMLFVAILAPNEMIYLALGANLTIGYLNILGFAKLHDKWKEKQ